MQTGPWSEQEDDLLIRLVTENIDNDNDDDYDTNDLVRAYSNRLPPKWRNISHTLLRY